MNYEITITETQKKAMEYAAADVGVWITNAAEVRANQAIEEIVALLLAHCNENSIALAVGKEAQVDQAYELGVVKTGADRNAEAETERV
jgi:hypothetical protein